jgi:carboxypeptidase C (cathepsin A)
MQLQPVNSGYSYYNGSEKISDSNAAANDVYVFLQLFYGEFPGKIMIVNIYKNIYLI